MSDTNHTLKKKENQYHHLTEKDRATIQALIEQKDKNGKRLFNNSYVANYLGVHRSTISRELKNRKSYRFMVRSGRTIEKPYNATDANNNYLFKRGLSKGEYKLKKYSKMAKYIEDKIKIDKWAPDVIVGYMKVHNYFDKDGFTSITVPTIYNECYRPEEINNRSTFGHFEIDTVIGSSRGKHKCLLTITERKTKFEIIYE